MRGTRDLLLVSGGAAVSAFGSALSTIVLLLHAQKLGPLAVAGVLVAGMIPVALGAPVAGTLVDRLPNRRLLISALLLQALATAAVAAVLDHLVLVLVLLLLIGCGTAVANPAASALVPKIAGENQSSRGYSWLATGRSAGLLAGTSAGALLVAGAGYGPALLIDAFTFAAEALALLNVRAERDPRGESSGEHARSGAMAGMAHIRRDPVLVVSVGDLAFAVGCIVLINVADPFYVVDVLHGNAVTLGAMQSCWVVGMLIGARAVARARTQRQLLLALGLAGSGIGLAACLPAAVPVMWVAALAWIVGGSSNSVQNVTHQALVRLRTPEALRGRVFAAASSALITANLLGTAASAGVVHLVGPRWAFAIGGTGAAMAGLSALVVCFRKTSPEQAERPARVTSPGGNI
jgi:MFS family permease